MGENFNFLQNSNESLVERSTEKNNRKFRLLQLPKRVLLKLDNNKPYGEYCFFWDSAKVEARPFMPKGLTKRMKAEWQEKSEAMWENIPINELSVSERYQLEKELTQNVEQLNTVEIVDLAEILPNWIISLISSSGINGLRRSGVSSPGINSFSGPSHSTVTSIELDGQTIYPGYAETSDLCREWVKNHWQEVELAVNAMEFITDQEKEELLKKLRLDAANRSPWGMTGPKLGEF